MSNLFSLQSIRTPTALMSLTCLTLAATAVLAQDEASPWIAGPTTAQLGDVAKVEIPNGYLFAGAEATRQLMASMGNPPSGQEMGLIAPEAEDVDWFVVFEYNPVGYVSDEDYDEIDAKAILKSISDATEAANKERTKMGAPALHVTGWSESPHYDPASNNLVWALEAKDDGGDQIVNYNVRLLGRRGYMSVTLVTDPAQLSRDKPEVNTVLAGFGYQDGQSYGEFVSGDKLAGYGLAALVAGGAGAAALKLGFFAAIGKFLGKIWKLLAIGVLFLVSQFKRLARALTGRPEPAQETAE